MCILNQFKGNNSSMISKLDVHRGVVTIRYFFTFHENPFIGYLGMAQFVDFKEI